METKIKNRISLFTNIVLAVLLISLTIWTLIPTPKITVKNITIQVLDCSEFSTKVKATIDTKNYKSNLVLDILKENKITLELTSSDLDAGYISSIKGLAAETLNNGDNGSSFNGYGWVYYVNYISAPVGISFYRVKDGDVITFQYEYYEF